MLLEGIGAEARSAIDVSVNRALNAIFFKVDAHPGTYRASIRGGTLEF